MFFYYHGLYDPYDSMFPSLKLVDEIRAPFFLPFNMLLVEEPINLSDEPLTDIVSCSSEEDEWLQHIMNFIMQAAVF